MARKIPSKKFEICLLLGQKVRAKRMSMGLTQTELASKISVNRAQLANLETGKTWVGAEAFYGLVCFLSLRIDKSTFTKKGKT